MVLMLGIVNLRRASAKNHDFRKVPLLPIMEWEPLLPGINFLFTSKQLMYYYSTIEIGWGKMQALFFGAFIW